MTITRSFSRRRLLHTSLLGVPLLAACSDAPAAVRIDDHGMPGTDQKAAAPVPDDAVETASSNQAPATEASQTVAPLAPRPRTIVLDPGHGAEEVGAASAIPGLPALTEKDSNLAFAWRLRELLEEDGYRVVMTRETDSRAFGYKRPENPSTGPGGLTPGRVDLQARIDVANNAPGDLFLSLHSNDSTDGAGENGVEVWYCGDREVGDANAVWAQIVLDNVLDALHGYGYRANNRGLKEDRYFRVRNGRNFHLFVLGPPNPESHHPRATAMPAALVENLFMRHERDIRVLRDPAGREAITQGMRRAVQRYFELRYG